METEILNQSEEPKNNYKGRKIFNMKKIFKKLKYPLIIIVVLIIFDGFFTNLIVPYFQIGKLITDTQKAVVRIKVTDEDGNIASGSGFIIRNDGIIVTNDHVLGKHRDINKNIQVLLDDNRIFNISDIGILCRNEIQDVAILKVNATNLPYLKVGSSTNLFQKTYVIGYPAGKISYAEGRISSKEETIIDGFSFIQMNTELDPGYSGSPVVNRYGQVIGIATAKIGSTLNFAVPIRYVKCLLDGINDDLVLFDNNIGNKIFEDNNIDWNKVSGVWKRYGSLFVNISIITEPFQLGAEGLLISDKKCGNFILESNMCCIARFDGCENIDMGIVFRYYDNDNFLIFSTYSKGEWNNDKGGLWKITGGDWKLLQSSYSIQPFEINRWYNIKIKTNKEKIQVYIDNIKCIDFNDPTYDNDVCTQKGNVGYRTVSSHTWFEGLIVDSLQ